VISSTRNPVSAKQKLSPLRSRRWIFPRLLAAFLFAGSPIAAHADALEDGARALARKVAADGKKDFGLSYTWENRSSVSSSTSERMRAAFEEELERLHTHLVLAAEGHLWILMTEGPSHINLIAQVLSQDRELIGAVAFPKGQFTAAERAGTVLRLDRQLLWQQPEMMFDLARSNDPSAKPDIMLVLGRESLSLYRWNQEKWLLKDSAPLPPSKLPQRDLRGEIHLEDHFFQFHLPGMECDGDAWQRLSFECEERTGIWRADFDPRLPFSLDPGRSFFAVDPHYIGPKRFSLTGFFSAARSPYSQEDFQYPTAVAGVDGHTYFYSDENEKEHIPESVERLPVEWGSDLVSLSTNCRQGLLVVVASGARDHTSRDTLQGFEVDARTVAPMTAATEFPGPILSLRNSSESEAMAIAFNLTTGNYEAYRVTMACGD